MAKRYLLLKVCGLIVNKFFILDIEDADLEQINIEFDFQTTLCIPFVLGKNERVFTHVNFKIYC